MNKLKSKQHAAQQALQAIPSDLKILGIGTGSTVNCFIESLSLIKHRIDGVVASSVATEQKLSSLQIPILDLNSVSSIPIYIDGTDSYNKHQQLIKGGGGALTREKIIASAAEQFICIVDNSKQPERLGKYPVAVEVIPMARSLVARKLHQLGGNPVYRQNYITDNGNIILDVHNLEILEPLTLEATINNIPGVVENGIFAHNPATKIIIGDYYE